MGRQRVRKELECTYLCIKVFTYQPIICGRKVVVVVES